MAAENQPRLENQGIPLAFTGPAQVTPGNTFGAAPAASGNPWASAYSPNSSRTNSGSDSAALWMSAL